MTNLTEAQLANEDMIAHYHELWHVAQAFRMSKSDLKARPIFHHTKEAIQAHMWVCFMALMIGKYLEIKTGLSLRNVRDHLWQVHEAHIFHEVTGETHLLRTEAQSEELKLISNILENSH